MLPDVRFVPAADWLELLAIFTDEAQDCNVAAAEASIEVFDVFQLCAQSSVLGSDIGGHAPVCALQGPVEGGEIGREWL